MVFGFFKRCLIIIEILVSIKKLSPADTREYIFNEALAHDLRYFFKTIWLCIEKCRDTHNSVKDILYMDEYRLIVTDIVNSLDKAFDDQDLKSVSKEYEKTLNNVLSRFAVASREDEDYGEFGGKPYNQNTGNNPSSLLNKMKKQLIKRGQYQDIDQKCQSSRTFNDLMNSNQLFKELRGEKRERHETHQAIAEEINNAAKGERATEVSEDEGLITPAKGGSIDRGVSNKESEYSTAYKAQLDKTRRQ